MDFDFGLDPNYKAPKKLEGSEILKKAKRLAQDGGTAALLQFLTSAKTGEWVADRDAAFRAGTIMLPGTKGIANYLSKLSPADRSFLTQIVQNNSAFRNPDLYRYFAQMLIIDRNEAHKRLMPLLDAPLPGNESYTVALREIKRFAEGNPGFLNNMGNYGMLFYGGTQVARKLKDIYDDWMSKPEKPFVIPGGTKRRRRRKPGKPKPPPPPPPPKPRRKPQKPTTRGRRRRTRTAGSGRERDEDDLYALFRRLDSDDSGELSVGELGPLANRFGMSAEDIMRGMDTNNNGGVNFAEFRKYMRRR